MAAFPEHARVVIIGLGGIVGASVAHHLVARGWDDIVGIDKSGIPTDIGSTAHASDFCYAYSHGLEWSVQAGDVHDEATTAGWLADILAHGAGRTDAILLRHACRARTGAGLAAVAALAAAVQPAAERRLETLAQGSAFALAASVWGAPLLAAQAGQVAYPVALGALAAAHSVPEDDAALGLLHAFTASLVSAAVRLVPLGQTAGLRIQAGLAPLLAAVTHDTAQATLDDIGGACFRSDIAAMRHETQYTRLFRT